MTDGTNSRGTALLIVGDALAYAVSLVLTLAVRYGRIPSQSLLAGHIPAFLILIVIFILVNVSAGLYDKQAAFIRGRIRWILVQAQTVNVIIGVIFFYFAPVSIAPKANLLIYFIISTLALFLWRLVMYPVLRVTKRQNAILIGSGRDIEDLKKEVNDGQHYGLTFVEHIVPRQPTDQTAAALGEAVERTGATVIVADFYDRAVESAMPLLYSMIFSGIQIADASRLYEAVFDRIPLTMVEERWLVENSTAALGRRRLYDTLKRIIDIAIAAVAGTISLVVYPFVYAAIKIEDGGPLFIRQERMGMNGKTVGIVKFRSMTGDDGGRYGKGGTTAHAVTRVGKFIRVTRIDELPQLWNVIRGDLSLIGPRPEFPSLAHIYEKEIPYYHARHLVKPGLSGWAQIYHKNHPHHEVDTEESRNKLSYDLFYVKNRSLALDMKIILRTLQILLERVGK